MDPYPARALGRRTSCPPLRADTACYERTNRAARGWGLGAWLRGVPSGRKTGKQRGPWGDSNSIFFYKIPIPILVQRERESGIPTVVSAYNRLVGPSTRIRFGQGRTQDWPKTKGVFVLGVKVLTGTVIFLFYLIIIIQSWTN